MDDTCDKARSRSKYDTSFKRVFTVAFFTKQPLCPAERPENKIFSNVRILCVKTIEKIKKKKNYHLNALRVIYNPTTSTLVVSTKR